jgi:cardiolipin synthase A/B
MIESGSVTIPVVALLIALGVVVLLVVVIWSIKRHRDPVLHLECDASIDELIPSLAGLSLSTALEGNSVEVLENGAYFDVLLADIAAAKHTVHFETFLWKDGVLGQRVCAALCERARAGVKVRVLLDAVGTRRMGKATERRMKEAGCQLSKFHPWHIQHIGVMNERDHRKLVVLDGRIAFVGGHCIVDTWLGNAEDGEHFADISVRLRGPIVHSVQAAFSENWVGHTGELFVGDTVFPRLERAGDVTIHAAYVKPEGSAPAVKLLHHAVIGCAKERIWIQNPYFIPEPEAIDAFGAAVARGVDVRVMMPSTSGSDNPMVQHAGHRNFEKLLRCGVRLFEYPSHAAAPEGNDRRRRVVRDRLEQLRRPLVRDQRRDHARLQGRGHRAAARRDLRAVRAAKPGDRTGAVAQARPGAQVHRQRLLHVQRGALRRATLDAAPDPRQRRGSPVRSRVGEVDRAASSAGPGRVRLLAEAVVRTVVLAITKPVR